MKKPKLLAPRTAAREMIDGPDVERMLASGSWVEVVKPKPRNKVTKGMAALRQRRREQGFHEMNVFLPEHVFKELCAQRRDGETFALLIERLLGLSGSKST